MVIIWGHILEEMTCRGLEMDVLCEGLLNLPINKITSSTWVRTMRGETSALTQQLSTGENPTLLLAHHTLLLGSWHPPPPGQLFVWREIGKLVLRHPPSSHQSAGPTAPPTPFLICSSKPSKKGAPTFQKSKNEIPHSDLAEVTVMLQSCYDQVLC